MKDRPQHTPTTDLKNKIFHFVSPQTAAIICPVFRIPVANGESFGSSCERRGKLCIQTCVHLNNHVSLDMDQVFKDKVFIIILCSGTALRLCWIR